MQHLVDGAQQPLVVGQHDVVELFALFVVDLARLQGLQIEADRGDGSLELVRDGVDEAVLLLVAADLPHQEDRVENDAGDDQGEKQHAQDQEDPGLPVQHESSRY